MVFCWGQHSRLLTRASSLCLCTAGEHSLIDDSSDKDTSPLGSIPTFLSSLFPVPIMVELRKRPPPKETATPPPAAKRGGSSTLKKLADKAKAAVTSKSSKDSSADAPVPVTEANGSAAGTGKIEVGKAIELDGFGGTVQTNDGNDVTFKELLDKSAGGVVIFTYPRASTPGCKHTLASVLMRPYTPVRHLAPDD